MTPWEAPGGGSAGDVTCTTSAADQLREKLLQLLRVVARGALLDLRADDLDGALDVRRPDLIRGRRASSHSEDCTRMARTTSGLSLNGMMRTWRRRLMRGAPLLLQSETERGE